MRFLVITGTLLATSVFCQAQSFKSSIKEVTVYPYMAKISGQSQINVTPGTSEIIIEQISDQINESSLQVGIEGNATLVSASYQLNHLASPNEPSEIKTLRDSLTRINTRLKRIAVERSVYVADENVLNMNNRLASQEDAMKVEDLAKLLDIYHSRLEDIKDELYDLEYEETKLTSIKTRFENQIGEWSQNNQKPRGELVIHVAANAAGKVKVNFNYLVNNAGWIPIYDIKAKGTEKTIGLTYKAQVRQSTGIDWTNVKLNISTANPSANNTKPELYTQFLDFWRDMYQPVLMKSKANRGMDTEDKLEEVAVADYSASANQAPIYEAVLQENAVAVEYAINLAQTIKSDNKNNTVLIKEYDIPASYRYYGIPKLDNAAFLVAEITEIGSYNLLPADANIYLNEMFVGTSYLNPRQAEDTVKLSLGRDEKIILERNIVKDLTSKKLIGTNKKEQHAYEIVVKNNKNAPIDIIIEDQYPISKQSEIEVELDKSDDAQINKETGKLTWTTNIPANQVKKYKFNYSIKYPKDKKVSGI